MTYQLNDFAEDLEYFTKNTNSHKDLIRESAHSMRKLLENKDLFSDGYIDRLNKGEESGRFYHSIENKFVILIFTWPAGSKTPVHDHDTWGIMGIYQNKLKIIDYDLQPLDKPGVFDINESENYIADEGSISYVLPPYEEIHKISNPTDDLTVSIHVYGKNIDEYNVYDLENQKIEHIVVSEKA